MEVSIAPEAVLQGASVLSGVRESLPSGCLPHVAGIGDQAVDVVRAGLEEWWTTMAIGMAEDVAALHQLVTSATSAHVARDRAAAADIEKTSDPFAAFRVG